MPRVRAENPELLDGDEMGSKPRRYLCHECQIVFESHPAGGLVEVDDWRGEAEAPPRR